MGGGDCRASEKGAQGRDFINDDRFALNRRGVKFGEISNLKSRGRIRLLQAGYHHLFFHFYYYFYYYFPLLPENRHFRSVWSSE